MTMGKHKSKGTRGTFSMRGGKITGSAGGHTITSGDAMAIGAGASVKHNGQTYTVPAGYGGVKIAADGSVTYF